MATFDSVFDEAHRLSPEDRLRLIHALWESIPEGFDVSLHPEWAHELERRVAAIEAGIADATPWTTIREEALARLRHGDIH